MKGANQMIEIFKAEKIKNGLWQSVFPSDYSEYSELHTTKKSAEKYITDVVSMLVRHGKRAKTMIKKGDYQIIKD